MTPITIRLREHGPLVVQEPVRVVDHQGNEFELPRDKEFVALCRCGQSRRRPFCDGSHRECGFQASDLAGGDDKVTR
jgi:CDGSH-type Zn-finger protein